MRQKNLGIKEAYLSEKKIQILKIIVDYDVFLLIRICPG
jgi:hypothetical protein